MRRRNFRRIRGMLKLSW